MQHHIETIFSKNIMGILSPFAKNDNEGKESLQNVSVELPDGTSVDAVDSPKTVNDKTANVQISEMSDSDCGDSDDESETESRDDNSKASQTDKLNDTSNNPSMNSSSSSCSSTNSVSDTYKLNITDSVYAMSDNDWPIREALIFRFLLKIKLF